MPTPTVEFIFDFASPNAYLVHKTIDGLVARTGISIEYIPAYWADCSSQPVTKRHSLRSQKYLRSWRMNN